MQYDINDTMFMIMILLSGADNFCLSPTELSERLCVSKTNITRLSDSLEKMGFIKRREDKEDRRRKYIYLMPEGRVFLQQMTKTYGVLIKNIWSTLTDDEVELFKSVSEKMLSHNIGV